MRKLVLYVLLFLSLCGNVLLLFVADRGLFYRHQLNALLEAPQLRYVNPGHQPLPQQTVLLIGDSIAYAYPLPAFLPQDYIFVNKGIRGEKTAEIAERYASYVTDIPHDVVLVEGGINDILSCVRHDKDCAGTLQKILKSAERIFKHARMHNKQTFYLSILPVTHRFLFPYTKLFSLPTGFDVEQVNASVREANRRMQDLCKDYEVSYVDVFVTLLEGDELSRAYAATDGYHINVPGYAAISRMLQSSVFTKIDSPPIGSPKIDNN